jgi:hypothetical protein
LKVTVTWDGQAPFLAFFDAGPSTISFVPGAFGEVPTYFSVLP